MPDTESQQARSATPFKKDYPAQVYPEDYRPPEYLAYLERAAAGLRTVRIIVYAGMAGFILLATYGFFLIYQLTTDTHRMVEQTVRMTEQMQSMTRIMSNMHESIGDMRVAMGDMRNSMVSLDRSVTQMSSTMGQMTNTVALIQHSARNLDQSIGPAAGMMNSFMPFFGNGYGGAPPYAPPAR
jgi:hypothetical protein